MFFVCLFVFFNPFGFSVWAKLILILSLSRLSRLFSRHPSPPTTSAALVANLDLPPVPPHEAGWEAAKPAKRSDKVTRFVPRERTERILLTRFKWSCLVCAFTSVCITSWDRGLWTGWWKSVTAPCVEEPVISGIKGGGIGTRSWPPKRLWLVWPFLCLLGERQKAPKTPLVQEGSLLSIIHGDKSQSQGAWWISMQKVAFAWSQ